jgi:hypothetical protein
MRFSWPVEGLTTPVISSHGCSVINILYSSAIADAKAKIARFTRHQNATPERDTRTRHQNATPERADRLGQLEPQK